MTHAYLASWRTAAVAAALALSAHAAQADMMSTCKSDISSLCSGVSDGRGRISACLFSQSSRLDAACRSEVEAVAQKDQNDPHLPASVRGLMGAGSAPAVPAACSTDEGTFCSGADAGNGNMLACLYAHSEQVSAGCSSAIKSVLE